MVMKRQSEDEILDFIRAVPGGNVPQYAKLLNTTAIRINSLLLSDEAKPLIKAGCVKASERGALPAWATSKTVRGSLRASVVDEMYKNGELPEFVSKKLMKIDSHFHQDALEFFRGALEQTANHKSFKDQMEDYLDIEKDNVDSIVGLTAETNALRLSLTEAIAELKGARRDLSTVIQNSKAQDEPKLLAAAESAE